MASSSKSVGAATSARYLFGFTLCLLLVGSLVPRFRVWGFSIWAYFPKYLPFVLVGLGVVIGVLEYVWQRRQNAEDNSNGPAVSAVSNRLFACWTGGIIAVFGAAFFLLRGRTHFLGDGYQLLAELAKAQPFIKPVETGETSVHLWIRNLVGGQTPEAALASYQIISIAAGVLFAVIASFGAARLFVRLRDRLIFLLGLLTGGYALLFFGYVENYSLLCVSILLFTITGMLIAQDRISRWWILCPVALAIVLHLVGAVLIPAAAYILVAGTLPGNRLARSSGAIKVLLFVVVLAAGGTVFMYLYNTSYYFRFAFVPIVEDRFTIAGYTMMSASHILDLVNLIFVLAPGVLMIAALLKMQQVKKLFETRAARFLAVLAISTLGAAAVLDPKLSMERDWDLFSFAGVPLVVLLLWLMLTHISQARSRITVAVLTVALGALSLFPRVATQAIPERGLATFMGYLELDPARSRTGMYMVSTHYLNRGDTALAMATASRRRALSPCEYLSRQAVEAVEAGQVAKGKALAVQSIERNAAYAESWLTLAKCYIGEGENDSALQAIRIADGLNPNNPHFQNVLGMAYFNVGDLESAEEIWKPLAEQSSSDYSNAFNLARLHQKLGDEREYERYLIMAASRPNAPVAVMVELANYHLRNGNIQSAADVCRIALTRGLDSSKIEALVAGNQQLAIQLGLPHK